jgi:hypothetical protein
MRQTSKGVCLLCQREFSKSGMARHLEVCRQHGGLAKLAGERNQAQITPIFHLFVEAEHLPLYWLHLEVATGKTLATLDRFLRDIWLEECCGHLSAFTIANVHYSLDQELFGDGKWTPRHQSMEIEMSKVLHPGLTFSYDYDFGSTTELRLKVIAEQDVEHREQAIRVLARNSLDVLPCFVCGKPSTSMCRACIYTGQEYLCETCAADHQCEAERYECDEETIWPRVNSPREGVCGYTGLDRVLVF